MYKDPAKLEACVWFIYTTLPIPPASLRTASATQLKWWLKLPFPVAEALATIAAAESELTMEGLPALLATACDVRREAPDHLPLLPPCPPFHPAPPSTLPALPAA